MMDKKIRMCGSRDNYLVLMEAVERYLLKRFPTPFWPMRIVLGDVYFMVEHRVESVAHRSGWFWPFRGKTWTEEVHEFRVASSCDRAGLSIHESIRIRDVKPGSELFFDLCFWKYDLVGEIEKQLVVRYENEKIRDKRIHSCMDSFREMCKDGDKR